MDTPITRAEHEEFKRRMEEENKRQDKRLDILEKNTEQTASLTISVAKMAQSIEQMVGVQEEHTTQLNELRERDGKMWRKLVSYTVTAVVGVVIGFIATRLGL